MAARKPSRRLSDADAAIIKRMLIDKVDIQSRIAARFDVNGGRISEINTGKKFADVSPAPTA